jgi:hypothetical protein
MRRFGAFTLVWLSLSTVSNCWQPRNGHEEDETFGVGAQPEPRLELSPSMIEEMGGFKFVQAALANASLPGKPKSSRQRQSNGLEARQTVCILCFCLFICFLLDSPSALGALLPCPRRQLWPYADARFVRRFSFRI